MKSPLSRPAGGILHHKTFGQNIIKQLIKYGVHGTKFDIELWNILIQWTVNGFWRGGKECEYRRKYEDNLQYISSYKHK